MEQILIGALALAVMLGGATITLGGRTYRLAARTLALVFALTAVAWVALLITVIGTTVRTIALIQP